MNEKAFVPFVPVNEDEKNSMITAVKGILLSKCVEIFASFDKEREKSMVINRRLMQSSIISK